MTRRRRLSQSTQAALAALSVGRTHDLPFVREECPLCGGQIKQSVTGTEKTLRHFTCTACPFWMSLLDTQIREAILGSTDPDDGDDTAQGYGFGYVWYNGETGKLLIYADGATYRRRKEFVTQNTTR